MARRYLELKVLVEILVSCKDIAKLGLQIVSYCLKTVNLESEVKARECTSVCASTIIHLYRLAVAKDRCKKHRYKRRIIKTMNGTPAL